MNIDNTWQRDEPDSPCVQLCVLHSESKLCLGCLRSGDEIAAWPRMSRAERQALLLELPARAPLIKPRRRKRPPR